MLGRKMNAQCVFSVHIRPKAIIDENPHNSSTQLKTSKCIKQYYQKILFRAGTLRELDTKRGTTTKMHLEVSEQKKKEQTHPIKVILYVGSIFHHLPLPRI